MLPEPGTVKRLITCYHPFILTVSFCVLSSLIIKHENIIIGLSFLRNWLITVCLALFCDIFSKLRFTKIPGYPNGFSELLDSRDIWIGISPMGYPNGPDLESPSRVASQVKNSDGQHICRTRGTYIGYLIITIIAFLC